MRNLGRKELSAITDENSKWHCYVCRSEPLQDLVSKCHRIMEKQELLQLKQRKIEKTEEHESKRHTNKSVKKHKEVVNGKEHIEGSGTMTFSYKKLQVPKELIKKAKKLVETTTGLNNTFIQFIQQASNEQGDKSVRYRHLKAFKAVLADLKKAHNALEAALEPEFRNMELQNGNEGQHNVRKTTDVVAPVENDHVDTVAVAVDEADACEELKKEQHNEQEVDNDQSSNDTEVKDSQTEIDVTKKTVKTEVSDDGPVSAGETSLDHDIMSVPPSVPEELFQMVESLADSTMLSQTDTNSPTDTDTESNGNSTDAQRPQLKVKNLIVKLTPVPVVTTCGSRTSRSSNREQDGELPKKCKEECKEDNDAAADTVDGTDSPPSRRSSRVKTTPLRKQTDNKGEVETSESEEEEDGKNKAKSSKKSNNTKKEDGKRTKALEKKTVDSDSDEVPHILLEKAAEGHSTDDEQVNTSAKKRLFKLNNTSTQDTDKASKRKRKSESSESDLENKNKKTSKKKRHNGSDSSNSDSEQEKESKSKMGTVKRRSGRVKKQDEPKERDQKSPDRKATERKRSYEKKRKGRSPKAAAKLDSSSSEDEEEEQQAEGGSGEDSDEQKIKPIVEDNVVGGSGPFHQSSGNLV